MKTYEYKIHYLKFKMGTSNKEQVLEALNQQGREGWRLIRQYSELSFKSLSSLKGGMNFLLEREL